MYAQDPAQDVFPYYGHWAGGDPRRFQPDGACCTLAEIEAWATACKFHKGFKGVDTPYRFGLGTFHAAPGPWVDWLADCLVEYLKAHPEADL